MATKKVIDPFNDSRVQHRSAKLNGITYKYLYGEPSNRTPRATIVLIHGWPDLSMGWRYQIPALLDLGLRVIAPDLMGFGGTEAPTGSDELSFYSQKRASDDIAELARQLGIERIILGGHDWGGAVVYRFAQHHPRLVAAVFSICTPYTPPHNEFVSLPEVVRRQPVFGYQLHLVSGEVERAVQTREQIRGFLNGMYGGRTPDRKFFFSPEKGLRLELLGQMSQTRLLSDRELEYYIQEYARNGVHGSLNWYRTRQINWEDERNLSPKIDQPVLFIAGLKDDVLLPKMARNMPRDIPNLTMREVNAAHWALWQAPDEVNGIVTEWLESVVLGAKSKI